MKIIAFIYFVLTFTSLSAQSSFYKSVYLKDQAKYNYQTGSQGNKVIFFNNRLYSICSSLSYNSLSKYYTNYLHFIKFDSNGDTLLSKLIYSDSINTLYNITFSATQNHLIVSFSKQKDFVYTSKVGYHAIELDTTGKIINSSVLNITIDSTTYITTSKLFTLNSNKYVIVSQNRKNQDSANAYLARLVNGAVSDTVVKFTDTICHHQLINIYQINNNRFLLIERQKKRGSAIPALGKTLLHLYDSNFNLLKIISYNDFSAQYDITIDTDTVLILGANYSLTQQSNDYIIYTLKKITIAGDSLSSWTSKKYTKDTVGTNPKIILNKGGLYIGSTKFLFKFENQSLNIIRKMSPYNPLDYCFVNDTMIGFTGGVNKISNIGIITTDGKFSGIKTVLKNNLSIAIYPNPSAKGLLNFKPTLNEAVRIDIFNTLGESVFSTTDTLDHTITTNLPKGLYFIKISGAVGSFKWLIE
ncbi:MAG: T9SS type A sorting domain-containing protein [Bacteroidota bacterium]